MTFYVTARINGETVRLEISAPDREIARDQVKAMPGFEQVMSIKPKETQ